jgi:Protein of unknown function (DUF1064)
VKGYSKYRSTRVVTETGEKFDSKKEYARYCDLLWEQKAGQIGFIIRQRRYPLKVNGKLICTYVADFTYTKGGKEIVEDSKGYATREYKIKRKLFEVLYPELTFLET